MSVPGLKIVWPVILLYLTTCNPFAPSITDENVGSSLILTDQRTPQEVMTNFAFAYNFKDSLVYSDIIDSTFLFTSRNFATNPVTPLSWGRDDELKATAGLFRNFEILRLDWSGTISEIYETQDSVQVDLSQGFLLTLNLGIDATSFKGIARFTLRKDYSGRWKIIRWEDESFF
jgi:hypothetical protein